LDNRSESKENSPKISIPLLQLKLGPQETGRSFIVAAYASIAKFGVWILPLGLSAT
jgi:hypothetical protein